MKFSTYLKDKKRAIVFFSLSAAVLLAVFALYRLPAEAVIYPVVICVFVGIVFVAADFRKKRKKHNEMCRLINDSAELADFSLFADTGCEKDFADALSFLQRRINELRVRSQYGYNDMVDYYTTWAHQIKTPISSMKLMLQQDDSDRARRMSAELFRMQQYVDMVLAFLRLGSETTDYVFREYCLDDIIKASVKNFAPDFIARRLSLKYEKTDMKIVTDRKWFGFMLEQVLSNALKYTRSGGILIKVSDDSILTVSDTGIGISKEDLPRIFEKGYTGFNGRTDSSSSGLGLYLCSLVCRNLGTDIRIESEAGKGTDVYIDVSQKRVTAE